MIKRGEILKEFEKDSVIKRITLSFEQSIKLIESLWHEGINLGVIPPKEKMEGIEVDIRIARILNSCLRKSSPG